MLKLMHGDCLEKMKEIPDRSVDLILCDLPYGMTDCRWDTIIDFEKLWEEYNRITKEDSVIALFSAQPFTTKVINSNKKDFKYNWYWIKNQTSGFSFAKYQPMRCVEDICVFYKKAGRYNPQGLKTIKNPKPRTKKMVKDNMYGKALYGAYTPKYTGYPKQILTFDRDSKNRLHPTQKPVKLLEYLIKTYTKEGDTVLDNCMGSGSTGVACLNTQRNFIGIELDNEYFGVAKERLEKLLKI